MKIVRRTLIVAMAVMLSEQLGHSLAAEALGMGYLITLTYALAVSPVFGVRSGAAPHRAPVPVASLNRPSHAAR